MNIRRVGLITAGAAVIWTTGCTHLRCQGTRATFDDDVKFLKKHATVLVLSDSTGKGKVAVVPDYQGRVMTSTADGKTGTGFGWINYAHIATRTFVPHMNAFGGEDRFWLGPEGGQFSIFFKKGVPFDFEHWMTPAGIDTEAYDVAMKSSNLASFQKDLTLENYSGTTLKIRVDREIRMLEPADVKTALGIKPDSSVRKVAYESINQIKNVGTQPWDKTTGSLSVWILGMFKPSAATVVIIPYTIGPEETHGPVVNDRYFGKVPIDRLKVGSSALFFSADGKYRSKIGLSPQRAKSVAGSYDAANRVLTIVKFNKPDDARDYVNSMWEIQKDPFKGDVVNSYNDGPATPGARPMGPFYELETSSPAAALAPGQSLTHTHQTFHFVGPEHALNKIAKHVLGVSLSDATNAFKP